MNTTIRGNNLRAVTLMALLTVLVVVTVAFAMQRVATTGGDDPAIRTTSAGGSSLTEDPSIERHAEVVARYHGGSLR